MEKTTKKIRLLYRNPVLSMAVLVGFLCLQFHSFSHIDFESLSLSDETRQTENTTTSQISGHSASDIDTPVDCADCVLTKHLQACIEQNVDLLLNNAYGFITTGTDHPVFESNKYLFQLRAPPFMPFN